VIHLLKKYGPTLCVGFLIGMAATAGLIYAMVAMATAVAVIWGLNPTKAAQ
jgi:hypothetical protein